MTGVPRLCARGQQLAEADHRRVVDPAAVRAGAAACGEAVACAAGVCWAWQGAAEAGGAAGRGVGREPHVWRALGGVWGNFGVYRCGCFPSRAGAVVGEPEVSPLRWRARAGVAALWLVGKLCGV